VEQQFRETPPQSGQSSQTGEVKEQAKQQGQQLAHQARQQANQLAAKGTEQVKSQLANQKHDASQRMVPIQSALRETAQQLRKQGQGSVAGYTDQAADRVERLAGYLRETEVDEMVDEVRGFARRRPALFLSSAAALGFLATRFLKSSSQQQGGAGYGYEGAPNASSRASVAHGAPTTPLPPAPADVSPGTVRPPTSTGAPFDTGRGDARR
jgi:hypothetical protein